MKGIKIMFRAWDIENKLMHDIAFPTWNGMVEVWENNVPQSKIKYLSRCGPEDKCILEQKIGTEWFIMEEDNNNLAGTIPNQNGRVE